MLIHLIILFNLNLLLFYNANADWESWWTYEGISGPDFWGRLNPKWSHCSKGKRQSPIDIDTSTILFDPNLNSIKINGDYVKGQLINTGRGISFLVDLSGLASGNKIVTISDGPFSYQYTLSNITLHFGRENNRGSEHSIDGIRFPGEIQLYGYNSQLYSNWSEAKREPNGLAGISIFIMITSQTNADSGGPFSKHNDEINYHQPNAALKQITGLLKNITKRGQSHTIESISIMDLLPTFWRHYVTYQGSLTQPACHETVQWVILNKPIYLSSYQFHMLRHSLKGDGHQDNFRPTQPLNKRLIRCNIINEQFQTTTTESNVNNKINQNKKFLEEEDYFDKTKPFSKRMIKRNPIRNTLFQNNDQNWLKKFSDGHLEIQPVSSENNSQNNEPLHSLANLMAVKDNHYCTGDQIRLYGYKDLLIGNIEMILLGGTWFLQNWPMKIN